MQIDFFIYDNTHALEDDTETPHPKFYLRLNIVGDFLWHVVNQKDVHKQSPLAPDRSQDAVLQKIETVI